MGNVVFIVWRESIEALLVIGILYTWLRNHDSAGFGLKYLWSGVGAGLLAAVGLAVVMLKVQSELAEQALEIFQIGILLVAAMLIVQMVFWMKRHGQTLKRNLQTGLAQAISNGDGVAVALLAGIAVAREGAETVIFVYGSAAGQSGENLLLFYASLVAGLILAAASFYLLNRSSHYLSWPRFFAVTEVILLLLASALLVSAGDKMIAVGWLPALMDPVWDSSFLLDDYSRLGNLIASITGYRARPSLMLLLLVLTYWSLIFYGRNRINRSLFTKSAADKKSAADLNSPVENKGVEQQVKLVSE